MAVLAAERGVVARHLVGRSAVTSFRCECHPGGESFLILCRLGKWELFDFEESFFLVFFLNTGDNNRSMFTTKVFGSSYEKFLCLAH